MKKEIEAIYGLSHQQQGYIYEAMAAPGTGIHIEQFVFDWHGEVDREIFARAWSAVMARHDILRTAFVWKKGETLVQVVLSEVDLPLRFEDWRDMPVAERDTRFDQFCDDDRRAGFEYNKAPLFRIWFHWLSAEHYRLTITIHHVLVDGWSLGLMISHGMEAYASLMSGREPALAKSPPFRDYIQWLERRDQQKARAFWKEYLHGIAAATPLGPGFSGMSEIKGGAGFGRCDLALSESLTQRLNEAIAGGTLSLNSVIQAAWALILSSFSGREEVVFGTTVSGRSADLDGIERMVGLFITSLPFRVAIDPSLPAIEWMAKLQADHYALRAFEYSSPGQIQEWSGVPAGESLFESLVVFENLSAGSEDESLAEIGVELIQRPSAGAESHHALTLMVWPQAAMKFRAVYDRSRLNGTFAAAVLDALAALLEAFAASPLGAVGSLLPENLTAPSAAPEADGVEEIANQARESVRFVAPATPIEVRLTVLCSALLGIEAVDGRPLGMADNFFVLGGHSLLATQLISRIRDELGVDIPLKTLFEQPTLGGLARAIEEHAPEGGILPGEVSAGQKPAPADASSVEPLLGRCDREAGGPGEWLAPMSFAQERLWFVDRLDPGSIAYNLPISLKLLGDLRVDLVARAFDHISKRHEVLRTRLGEYDGRSVQIIDDRLTMPFNFADLSGLPRERRDSACRTLMDQVIHRPFSLVEGPLWRGSLSRLDEKTHVLLINMHHVISDGWSLMVVLREFAALYNAYWHGRPSPLCELPVQYADFSTWQRKWLKGNVLARQLAYWEKELEDAPPTSSLPLDFPRPPIQRTFGEVQLFTMPAALAETLTDLGHREGATLFMVLTAGFGVFLSHLSRQGDVCIGTPLANRNQSELEGLIGFLANSLVLRMKFHDDPSSGRRLTFRDMVARVRRTAIETYEYQHLPFEQIVERLQPQRDLSHSPLFQINFTHENIGIGNAERELQLPGLSLEPIPFDYKVSKFDINITISRVPSGGFEGAIEYNTDLFRADTIRTFVNRLRLVLEGLASRPDDPVALAPLMGEAECGRILGTWSGQTTDYPRDLNLIALFEEQVELRSEAPALREGDRIVNYRELNERANRMANQLIEGGLAAGDYAGLCLNPGADTIAAILAILKAGAAYVPLDPEYPGERIGFMLKDTGLTALVTHSDMLDLLPAFELNFLNLLVLDQDEALIAEQPDTNPGREIAATAPAYAMYTSGSTGVPKGVVVPHRAVVRLVRDTDYLDFSAEDVFLQASSISFDASTLEIWGSLLNGAMLALMPAKAIDRLPALLGEYKVSVLWLTAQLFNLMVDRHLDSMANVRQLLAGGDALSPLHVRKFLERFPANRLINGYGPTENTTFTCCCDLRAVGLAPFSAPIGTAIANTRVYIVDPLMRPVPPGVAGELMIAGDGLALGYLNRPDLTAEKFIPNPLAANAETNRLYRTGDLARYLADGNIEFMGRVDRQIKLRGYRIELGEIEKNLTADGRVADAIVRLITAANGDKRLIAYIQPAADAESEDLSRELRVALGERLPAHMVPSALVTLAAFPLTPNGKIDFKALPQPEFDEAASASRVVMPRTPTEQMLASIWAEVLNADPEQIGLSSDFFELGGHSLLATQVISRVRDLLQVDLPLRSIFEHPRLVDQASDIETGKRQSSGFVEPPIVRVDRSGPLPLSFAQERLWFLDRFEEGGSTYNVPLAYRIEGPLDEALLERCFREVAQARETLRTRFGESDGKPLLIIDEEVNLSFESLDLRELPEETREVDCLLMLAEEAHRSFSLERGPLFRLTIYRLGETDRIFLLTLHHIISDAWTLNLLFSDFFSLYRGFVNGEPGGLEERPIQYVDFAHWQRGWLRGEVLQRQLEFWRQRLEGAPAALELRTDRPRPPVQTFHGKNHIFLIDEARTAAIRKLCAREGATMFMVLLAAFGELLRRYSGQADISIGTTIANRNRSAVENILGFFVNTLTLRTRYGPGENGTAPPFRELIARVRRTCLDAYDGQDLPFEQIVAHIQKERDLSRSPLFQVLFAVENTGFSSNLKRELIPGLSLTPQDFNYQIAKYDLSVFVTEASDVLVVNFNYNADLFEPTTMARMAEHYQTLVDGLIASPERPAADIEMLTETERAHLLRVLNPVPTEIAFDRLLPELVAARASANPEKTALVSAGGKLSYAQMTAAVTDLASRLRGLGAGPEVPVAVFLDRTADLVIALLAVLEAGAVYVPLDPNYPTERVSHVLEDCGAPLVLTHRGLSERLPATSAHQIWVDERHTQGGGVQPVASTFVRADNAAYIIYTSGSTGRPKGVQVTHRCLLNFLFSMAREPGLNETDVLLAVTTVSFDIAGLELYLPLLVGARLVLATSEEATDGDSLLRLIAAEGVTAMQATPITWQLLLAAGWRGSLKMLCGGEALPGTLAKQLLESGGEVWNLYGPTETTIWSAARRVDAHSATAFAVEPVGAPIANTSIHVVDSGLRLLPAGIAGELCIGGEGLARGYFKRGDLTAERFVPDPFSESPGQRLYRTGDRVSRLAGTSIAAPEIEFLGRLDHQIKLRGFRIELGEIETRLRAHPAVKDAVVILDRMGATAAGGTGGGMPGAEHLVAFLVLDDPGQNGELPKDLTDFLAAKLPAYMVPAAFALLDTFPLTPNGKIDRKALAAGTGDGALKRATGSVAAAEYVAPRSPVEEELTQIWSEVLGIETIGVSDHFFKLGGHSLLATQVMARIRNAFKVELPLRSLFEKPTIGQLGEEIVRAMMALLRGGPAQEPEIRLEPVSRHQDLPLSFSQQRLWFVHQLDPDGMPINIPNPLELSGELQVPALEAALSTLVRRHETLRTLFRVAGRAPVQIIGEAKPVKLTITDLGDRTEDEAEREGHRLLEAETTKPFDLSSGPLWRFGLIKISATRHLLLLTLHHIISDAWSMGVLVRELGICYRAHVRGETPVLDRLPVQYADFAQWQRAWFSGRERERQLAYWRKTLAGDLPVLPTARPRPKVPSYRGATAPFACSPHLTARIKARAQEAGVTLFMAMLTAYKVMLAGYAAQDDIITATPIANRTRAELEGLIGFFVNTLVLRTSLAGNPSLRELLERVRETAMGAFGHQDMPFEKLVEELKPAKTLSYNPIFQSMFTFQNVPGADLDMEGLAIKPLMFTIQVALYDLTMAVQEIGDQLVGLIIYSTDVVDGKQAQALTESFLTILETLADEPDRRLDSLTLAADATAFPARTEPVRLEEPARSEAARVPTVPEVAAAQVASSPKSGQEGVRRLPIGHPFSTFEVYLIDESMQPAPIGIPGELCIGGDGLARGYLGRPAQTAEKFVPNPFSGVRGDRMYLTGDLAGFLPDGNIEFYGRIDFQVKVRGFRIELGEIENVLNQHPWSAGALVRAIDDKSGSKRLVAYLQVKPGCPAGMDELRLDLRDYLLGKLPEYMVPAALVLMERFPLTPNGKVDVKGLPAPTADEMAGERIYTAPRTAVEERIAAIWEEILEMPQVGVHDNFFELGGHSLLVATCVSRMRDAFGVVVPIKDFFEQPVVEDLAQYIEFAKRALQTEALADDSLVEEFEEEEIL